MSRCGHTRKLVICGYGSLGRRLAQHLIHDNCHLVLLDDYAGFHKSCKPSPLPDNNGKVEGTYDHIQAVLTEWGDWTSTFEGAYAVVHFAAVNPYPEATWEDSRLSMRMNSNVIAAAQHWKVRRLVLASSSHVLGGYLQDGAVLSENAPGLGPQTPFRHFTRFRLPGFETDASGYSAAKVALEEMALAATLASVELSVVVVRIGWCQPGENHPSQMSATATPTISSDAVSAQESVAEEMAKGFDNRDTILAWLHRLWLSTPDFNQLFKCAIDADIQGFRVVCGVSNNKGMRWSKEGWRELGYDPQDDVMKVLAHVSEETSASAKRQKV